MSVVLPVVSDPLYSPSFPDGHRFPMGKFEALRNWVQASLPQAVVYSPEPIDWASLYRVHDRAYVDAFQSGQLAPRVLREIGLPWSPGLARRTPLAVSGTWTTARLAITNGVACHLAGGTHHAHADRGSGFCIYNDLAVTARRLLFEGMASRVLIFDCDVHQGDGTARILAQDSEIFTCSLHAARNFPVRRAHSDLDVDLPDGMTDSDYIGVVQETWHAVISAFRPDFVLYDAGADVHRDDVLGRLSITDAGMYARDRSVIEACLIEGVPIATVIGGGYDRDISRLAQRHGIVVQAALDALMAQKTMDKHLHFENRLA